MISYQNKVENTNIVLENSSNDKHSNISNSLFLVTPFVFLAGLISIRQSNIRKPRKTTAVKEILMPALSSTMKEGKITSWLKKEGDKLKKGEKVLVVESDKADMDVETFVSGTLGAIFTKSGESAPVGSVIGLVAQKPEDMPELVARVQGGTTKGSDSVNQTQQVVPVVQNIPNPIVQDIPNPVVQVVPTPVSIQRSETGKPSSPAAKALAKKLGLNIADIPSINKRISEADVIAYKDSFNSTTASLNANLPVIQAVKTVVESQSQFIQIPAYPLPGKEVPMNAMQKAVAKNMSASLSIPTYRIAYDLDVTLLEQKYKDLYKAQKTSFSLLLLKGIYLALEKNLIMNSRYVESSNSIFHPDEVRLAVAVAIPDGGLITPVITGWNVNPLNVLSEQWNDLVTRAKNKSLKPEEYASGTFTVSNLGMFGVPVFDSIVPPNQAGILALGATQTINNRRILRVNLSADHRNTSGSDGAKFLKDLSEIIVSPNEWC